MSATILPFERPARDAIMALHSKIPETGHTANLLGTERESTAVQIHEDGLLLTVGYSVMEAEEVWLTNRKGQTAEGIVLCHDFDSGIALIKSSVNLGRTALHTAMAGTVMPGDNMTVLSAHEQEALATTLFAREQYTGRWEYMLDEAFYTIPLCEHWSGSALLNNKAELVGIGSLALGLRNPEGDIVPGNMYIPVDLVTPHIDYMSLHGKKPGTLRPWLGTLVEEHDSQVYIVGLYPGAPAAKAGLKLGDIIIAVAQEPVTTMAELFKTLWSQGPAGNSIQLSVKSVGDHKDVVLDTIDRNSFFMQPVASSLN